MSRLLEFLLGSLLITVFTVAAIFFFALQHLLRAGGIGNCAWQASARAWIDSNRDGQPNPGEPPLSDVQIHVNDIQNELLDVSWPAITDQEGDVQLIASIPGCADTVLEIRVDIPDGYRITTTPRIEIQPHLWKNPDQEPIFYFGFASDR